MSLAGSSKVFQPHTHFVVTSETPSEVIAQVKQLKNMKHDDDGNIRIERGRILF